MTIVHLRLKSFVLKYCGYVCIHNNILHRFRERGTLR